ncbi:MAG: flagellar basal body rod protein FlgC [Ignavibacteriae bacterium]|nr:flagellar basal body rod protein FlgC [Ignavibacteriota bacterium]MCB9206128.1 flagellar basal body rod protein FlgC [Ignavibacteriales bacterium]MCB9209401.1 flagellar basal body rod protein FlgC [Ignavibacteriales bacterium]MCB9258044.1 flagellar basal body rod protein FlgC [Ignavibacteriales bacterium]
MKINPNFSSFKISGKGMSIQKQRMDVITENIANTSTTKTEDGSPYKRKFISVEFEKDNFQTKNMFNFMNVGFKASKTNHMLPPSLNSKYPEEEKINFEATEYTDNEKGELVYMPDHPDANKDGYVEMPNVNVVTEMVDMISASRSFEANLTAFNAAKQIAKDSLEI